MAGQSGFSLPQDRGIGEFSAHVEKPWRIECVVFSLALGHSGDFSKKKNSSVAGTQNLEMTESHKEPVLYSCALYYSLHFLNQMLLFK